MRLMLRSPVRGKGGSRGRAGRSGEPRRVGAAAEGEAQPPLLRVAVGSAQLLQDGQGLDAVRRGVLHQGAPGEGGGAGEPVEGDDEEGGGGGGHVWRSRRRGEHLKVTGQEGGGEDNWVGGIDPSTVEECGPPGGFAHGAVKELELLVCHVSASTVNDLMLQVVVVKLPSTYGGRELASVELKSAIAGN